LKAHPGKGKDDIKRNPSWPPNQKKVFGATGQENMTSGPKPPSRQKNPRGPEGKTELFNRGGKKKKVNSLLERKGSVEKQ